jgi:hypothetical protein
MYIVFSGNRYIYLQYNLYINFTNNNLQLHILRWKFIVHIIQIC